MIKNFARDLKDLSMIVYGSVRDFLNKDVGSPVWAILTIAFMLLGVITQNIGLTLIACFVAYKWGIAESEAEIICDECGISLTTDEMISTFDRR